VSLVIEAKKRKLASRGRNGYKAPSIRKNDHAGPKATRKEFSVRTKYLLEKKGELDGTKRGVNCPRPDLEEKEGNRSLGLKPPPSPSRN